MSSRRNARSPLARALRWAGLVGPFAPARAPRRVGARPLEPEITSDTAAQFYDVRSPTGETVIARRRLTTTLGVSVYDLYDKPERSDGPEPLVPCAHALRRRLRRQRRRDRSRRARRLVPGFDRGPIDLMYGYVEGRRFLARLARLQARSPVRRRLARLVVVRRRPGEDHDALLLRRRGLRRARAARGHAALDAALRARGHLARRPHRLRPDALSVVPAERHRARLRRRPRVGGLHVAARAAHLPSRVQHGRVERLPVRERPPPAGLVQRHARLAGAHRLRASTARSRTSAE